jgi:hypothetical protein
MMRLSAKQITMFGVRTRKAKQLGGCPRQWAAYYLEKLRPAFLAPQLVFGIKLHKVCATLVQTGRMPSPGELQPGVVLTPEECAPESQLGCMARKAMMHLPRSIVPETGDVIRAWIVEAETHFMWETDQGLQVEIDLRPDVYSDGLLVDLIDWKSTSDKQWALKTLLDDVQANLYALGLMQMLKKHTVSARWVYVEKKTPFKSWPLDCIFHYEKTSAWLHENVDATIELIHTLRETPGLAALDLPAEPEACEGIGKRCDYMGPCLGPVGPRESRLIQLETINRYREGNRS